MTADKSGSAGKTPDVESAEAGFREGSEAQCVVPRIVAWHEKSAFRKRLVVIDSLTQQLVIHALPGKIAECRAKAATLGGGLDPKEKEFVARGLLAWNGFDPEDIVFRLREPAP